MDLALFTVNLAQKVHKKISMLEVIYYINTLEESLADISDERFIPMKVKSIIRDVRVKELEDK